MRLLPETAHIIAEMIENHKNTCEPYDEPIETQLTEISQMLLDMPRVKDQYEAELNLVDPKEDPEPYITTINGVGGYRAALFVWDGQGYVCENTLHFAYGTEDIAIVEAQQWAEDTEIQYKARTS